MICGTNHFLRLLSRQTKDPSMFEQKAKRSSSIFRCALGATALFAGASLLTAMPANAFTLDGIVTSGDDNYTSICVQA